MIINLAVMISKMNIVDIALALFSTTGAAVAFFSDTTDDKQKGLRRVTHAGYLSLSLLVLGFLFGVYKQHLTDLADKEKDRLATVAAQREADKDNIHERENNELRDKLNKTSDTLATAKRQITNLINSRIQKSDKVFNDGLEAIGNLIGKGQDQISKIQGDANKRNELIRAEVEHDLSLLEARLQIQLSKDSEELKLSLQKTKIQLDEIQGQASKLSGTITDINGKVTESHELVQNIKTVTDTLGDPAQGVGSKLTAIHDKVGHLESVLNDAKNVIDAHARAFATPNSTAPSTPNQITRPPTTPTATPAPAPAQE